MQRKTNKQTKRRKAKTKKKIKKQSQRNENDKNKKNNNLFFLKNLLGKVFPIEIIEGLQKKLFCPEKL